jgi:hypothetical protein
VLLGIFHGRVGVVSMERRPGHIADALERARHGVPAPAVAAESEDGW